MSVTPAKSKLPKIALPAVAGFVVGLVATVIWFRQPGETLTAENLAAARRAWRDAAVRSYRLDYFLHGDRYEIIVREGIVEKATVNGQPPHNRNLRQYTMDGLFDLLELELENLSDPHGPFGVQSSTIITRVRFHPLLGYLERFVRSSGGLGRGASIEVVKLQPLDQSGRPS